MFESGRLTRISSRGYANRTNKFVPNLENLLRDIFTGRSLEWIIEFIIDICSWCEHTATGPIGEPCKNCVFNPFSNAQIQLTIETNCQILGDTEIEDISPLINETLSKERECLIRSTVIEMVNRYSQKPKLHKL